MGMYSSFCVFPPGLLDTEENVGESLGVKKNFHLTPPDFRAFT